MRLLGSLLMGLGVAVGIAVAGFVVFGTAGVGVHWLLSVAIAKLAFASSLGLIGAGAVVHRIDKKHREQAQLRAPPSPPTDA